MTAKLLLKTVDSTKKLVIDGTKLVLGSAQACIDKCCGAAKWYCCWLSNNHDEGRNCQRGPCSPNLEHTGPYDDKPQCIEGCDIYYCCYANTEHTYSACTRAECDQGLYRSGPYYYYERVGAGDPGTHTFTKYCKIFCEERVWCCYDPGSEDQFCVFTQGSEDCASIGMEEKGYPYTTVDGPWSYEYDWEESACEANCGYQGATGACCKPPRDCIPLASGPEEHVGPYWTKDECEDCVATYPDGTQWMTDGCQVWDGPAFEGTLLGWANESLCIHDGLESQPCVDGITRSQCISDETPCTNKTECSGVGISGWYDPETCEWRRPANGQVPYAKECWVYLESDCTGEPIGFETYEGCTGETSGHAKAEWHKGKTCAEVNCPGDCYDTAQMSSCRGSSTAGGVGGCLLTPYSSIDRCSDADGVEVTVTISNVTAPTGCTDEFQQAEASAWAGMLQDTFVFSKLPAEDYCHALQMTLCDSTKVLVDDGGTYNSYPTYFFVTIYLYIYPKGSIPYGQLPPGGCAKDMCANVAVSVSTLVCYSEDPENPVTPDCDLEPNYCSITGGGNGLDSGTWSSNIVCGSMKRDDGRTKACDCSPIFWDCNLDFGSASFVPTNLSNMAECLHGLLDGATVSIRISSGG